MSRITNLMFLVLFLTTFSSAQEHQLFPVPALPDGEVRVLNVRYEDPKMTDAYFASKPINQRILHDEASASIETTIKYRGEGNTRQLIYLRKEILHNRTISEWKFTFAPSKNLILQTIEHEVRTPSGKTVRKEFFDLSDPVFKYPPDSFHPYTLELFFRSLPLKIGYKGSFHLWLAPKSVIRMTILVDKTEKVKTPAGEFECFCLQMTPNLEDFLGKAGKVVQPLIPGYTFWLAVKGTHPVVKYRGPLGEVNMVGAPIEIHELTKITPPL